MGEKGIVLFGWSTGKGLENVEQPRVRVDRRETAGRKERAIHRDVDRRIVRTGEEIVLATQREGPDSIFNEIVVDLEAAVKKTEPANESQQPARRQRSELLQLRPARQRGMGDEGDTGSGGELHRLQLRPLQRIDAAGGL